MAVFCGPVSCVLPPPPLEERVEEVGFSLMLDLLTPPGTGPVEINRTPFDEQFFSVKDAIVLPDGAPVNVFWFVNFDVDQEYETLPIETPATSLRLRGCDTLLIGTDPMFITVDALITEGDLVVDNDKDDPRVTANGEPIQRVSWALVVKGSQAGCQ